MALHDEEQRQLAEIERRLAEDDPQLAQKLTRLRPFGMPRAGIALITMFASFVLGLAVVAIGAEVGSFVLGIIGIVLAVGLPTVLIWRLWLRRLR
ncbi:DUF3040 domain-containing protein [Saccharomonospora sp. NPDC006951]